MIRFVDLIKRFGDRTVLKGVSFQVQTGEIVFIIGTSGTGKSVLLKNLVGLLSPDSGSIEIDGVDVSRFSEEQFLEIRKKCGMVFQQPALFDSLTIYENVAFGLRRQFRFQETEVQMKVRKALELVHLKNIENKLPTQISYGMQKRVSLARTIALEPKILLFDEPTTGLDPVTTNSVNQLILELSRTLKTTSIVVSHDMRCALSIADKIIVLDQGQIVEQGTAAELKLSKVELVQNFLLEAREV